MNAEAEKEVDLEDQEAEAKEDIESIRKHIN